MSNKEIRVRAVRSQLKAIVILTLIVGVFALVLPRVFEAYFLALVPIAR
ncbi:MAG TPA: hypothetical protein VFB14_24010 [Bryobacteraceae bacterium]|jgi:hypothetical protein|nr:hypothetical protein [Bryobacteraceae bacterium]